jgi:hypothetical protein
MILYRYWYTTWYNLPKERARAAASTGTDLEVSGISCNSETEFLCIRIKIPYSLFASLCLPVLQNPAIK